MKHAHLSIPSKRCQHKNERESDFFSVETPERGGLIACYG